MEMLNKDAALESLKTNYTKVGHPIAFSNPQTIFNYFHKVIPIKEIETYVSGKNSYTLHRENRKRAKSYIPMFALRPRDLVETDLCDMQYFSPAQNDDTRHLLIGKQKK